MNHKAPYERSWACDETEFPLVGCGPPKFRADRHCASQIRRVV